MGIPPQPSTPEPPTADRTLGEKQHTKHVSNSLRSNTPTSISIKSEAQMAAPGSQSSSGPSAPISFGVERLKDVLDGVSNTTLQDSKGQDPQSEEDLAKRDIDKQHSLSATSSPQDSPPTKQDSPSRRAPLGAALLRRLPLPLDSPFLHSPGTDSVPMSTPCSASMKSLRLSDDEASVDGTASQALASSPEDECDQQQYPEPTDHSPTDNAPQFVMPSVQMPSRRPFTERGKHLGRLNIMVAGKKSSGKTSLIKSIARNCEDIVHVDPIDCDSIQAQISDSGTVRLKASSIQLRDRNQSVKEVLASTRAYPSWMADQDTSRLLKRRQGSYTDVVLERNVCFIDTPGFDDDSSFERHSASLLQYITNSLHRNASLASLNDSDLVSILNGSGGTQVDVVLYLISAKEMDPAELDLIRQLSSLTNVIPVITQADQLDQEEILRTGTSISNQLKDAGSDFFDIRRFLPDSPGTMLTDGPLCVSSATARDDETLDASILMSSEYLQPLQPSDLGLLIQGLFDPETSACLRYQSSRKLLQWRRDRVSHMPSMSLNSLRAGRRSDSYPTVSPVAFRNSAVSSISATSVLDDSNIPSAVLIQKRRAGENEDARTPSPDDQYSPPSSPYKANGYTTARILDHTQREERLAQVRLARWSTDLQRALRNERARFASLKQNERRAWLEERLEECVDANLDEREGSVKPLIRKGSHSSTHFQRTQAGPGDPLGLLEWRARLSQRGVMVAKLVGGVGVLGVVVVWAVRTWGWGLDLVPEDSSLRSNAGWISWWWVRE